MNFLSIVNDNDYGDESINFVVIVFWSMGHASTHFGLEVWLMGYLMLQDFNKQHKLLLDIQMILFSVKF